MSVHPKALEQVIFPVILQSIANGEEKNLDSLLGMGLSIEEYFTYVDTAINALFDQKRINTLRYLELKHFLSQRKGNLHEFQILKDRLQQLVQEISKPVFYKSTNLSGDNQ